MTICKCGVAPDQEGYSHLYLWTTIYQRKSPTLTTKHPSENLHLIHTSASPQNEIRKPQRRQMRGGPTRAEGKHWRTAHATKQNQPLKLQAPTMNLQQHGGNKHLSQTENKITTTTHSRYGSYTPKNKQKSSAGERMTRPTKRSRRESKRKGRKTKLDGWGISEST